MLKRVAFVTLFTCICLFSPNKPADADVLKPKTYSQPLAYIGWDGNIWVTDIKSGAGTRITNDGDPRNPHFYTNLHWSPQGSMFSVSVEDHILMKDFMYVFKSGAAPLQVDEMVHGVWTPEGAGLAEPDCFRKRLVIKEVNLDTMVSRIATWGDCGGPRTFWGDGPSPNLSESLVASRIFFQQERAFNQGQATATYIFVRTGVGYLTRSVQDLNVGPWKMLGLDGKVLWENSTMNFVAFSPDGKVALGMLHDAATDVRKLVMIDLYSGSTMPSTIPDFNGEALAFTSDLRTLVIATPPDDSGERSYADYDPISLWQFSLDRNKLRNYFTRIEYGIGMVTLTPDNSGAVVSFITSARLFSGSDHPSIAQGVAHVELLNVDLKSGNVRFLALGRSPRFGRVPFTAVPAK